MSTCSRRACAALATLADQAAVEMARYRRLHTDVEHAAGVSLRATPGLETPPR